MSELTSMSREAKMKLVDLTNKTELNRKTNPMTTTIQKKNLGMTDQKQALRMGAKKNLTKRILRMRRMRAKKNLMKRKILITMLLIIIRNILQKRDNFL